MTKLRFETSAGQVSEALTFGQLIEHLRLAQEAAYTIGHIRKANGDKLTGQGFLAVGELLKMAQINVTKFATEVHRK